MNWKTLVLSVALSSVAVVGCSPAPVVAPMCVARTEICGNGMDENCNGMADDVCVVTEPMTRTYVVSTIDTGEDNPDAAMAYGFDLDGMDGGAAGLPCTAALDFTSLATGDGSVDNQLSTVLPVIGTMLDNGVNGAIQEQIQGGTLLLMFEVSDINSFTTDTSVMVHIVLGEVAAGATIMTDGTGLAADQTFAMMTDVATVMGTIESGRLSAETAMLPLAFDVSGTAITLTLRDVVIGGDITATSFGNAEFGAVVAVTDVVTLAGMFIAGADIATVEGLAMPDIDPGTMCDTHTTQAACETASCSWSSAASSCGGDGEHCASISAGLGFETVAATLE